MTSGSAEKYRHLCPICHKPVAYDRKGRGWSRHLERPNPNTPGLVDGYCPFERGMKGF